MPAQHLPLAYLRLLLQTLEPLDDQTHALIKQQGLDEPTLAGRTQSPSLAQQWPVFEHLLQGRQGAQLGWQLGLRMQLALHGILGVAFYSAPTLAQGLQILQRYLPLRAPIFCLAITGQGDNQTLTLEPASDLEPFTAFFTHATVAALLAAISSYLGKPFTGAIALATGQSEDSAVDYAPYTHQIVAGAGQTCIQLPAAQLAQSSLLSDPVQHRAALQQCEQALLSLAPVPDDLHDKLSQFLADNPGRLWTLEEIAHHLHMSPRTLNRRLQRTGLSYHQLRTRYLQQCACQLLNNPHLSIDAIAAQLGFHDSASFRRSFKRWLSATPSEYRAGRV